MTNKEATIRGLEKLGFVRNPHHKSKKYLVYAGGFNLRVCADGAWELGQQSDYCWLVGRSGALRLMRTSIDESLSYTDNSTHDKIRYLGRSGLQLRSSTFHCDSTQGE